MKKVLVGNFAFGQWAYESPSQKKEISTTFVVPFSGMNIIMSITGISPLANIPSPFSLRLGHTQGKTIINRFLRPSCRFATLKASFQIFGRGMRTHACAGTRWAITTGKQKNRTPFGVLFFWWPVRESNPCFQRERLASWPLDQRAVSWRLGYYSIRILFCQVLFERFFVFLKIFCKYIQAMFVHEFGPSSCQNCHFVL